MSWSTPCAIISPGTYACPLTGAEPDHARGGRGILGVVSDDMGETWSEEFVDSLVDQALS